MRARIIWKPIPTFPGYLASNTGQIRSPDISRVLTWKGKILRPGNSGRFGHKKVVLYRGKRRVTTSVHRAVLMAFRGKPKKKMVARHLDGCPENNNIGNLRWGTMKQNSHDKIKHGYGFGERHGRAILTEKDVREIRRRYIPYKVSFPKLAKEYGVHHSAIYSIIIGKTWKHI